MSPPDFVRAIPGMDVSLMARMKELEEENRRPKTLDIEAQIKADIVAEALAKKPEDISPARSGQLGSGEERPEHPLGVRGVRSGLPPRFQTPR